MTRRQPDRGHASGALAAALCVSALWLWLLLSMMAAVNHDISRSYDSGYEQAKREARQELVVIEDEPAHRVPLYLQKDLNWSGVEYGGGTIGTHGCGLTCAAMAISYITGDAITPDMLASQSDGAFITNGINDPDKICKWLSDNYGVSWSGEKWTLEDGLALVDQGYVVIAGMKGKLGDRSYSSHDVLIYAVKDGGYLVRDPDDAQNSNTLFTMEQLQEASWGSFNGIK